MSEAPRFCRDQTVRDKSGKTALDLAADESVRRALAPW